MESTLLNRTPLARPATFGLWGGLLVVLGTWATAAAEEFSNSRVSATKVQPGTAIGREAPDGWSHLIIKSKPRVTEGDIDAVGRSTADMASLLFTVIVADVVNESSGDSPRYRLGKVGVGAGTVINGNDVIISSSTQSRLGADFGLIKRQILSKFEEKLAQNVVVLRTSNLAFLDTPVVVRHQGKNRPMMIRYAIIVNPDNGELDTICWLIDLDDQRRYRGVVGRAQWLPPAKQEDAKLYVDQGEFFLGIPSENAFATLRIPQGRLQFALPDAATKILGKSTLNQAEAKIAEGWFHTVVEFLRNY